MYGINGKDGYWWWKGWKVMDKLLKLSNVMSNGGHHPQSLVSPSPLQLRLCCTAVARCAFLVLFALHQLSSFHLDWKAIRKSVNIEIITLSSICCLSFLAQEGDRAKFRAPVWVWESESECSGEGALCQVQRVRNQTSHIAAGLCGTL